MKHQAQERKASKNKHLSASNKKALKVHLLENAKQSFYAEGIEFNNNAWDWYSRKSKNA